MTDELTEVEQRVRAASAWTDTHRRRYVEIQPEDAHVLLAEYDRRADRDQLAAQLARITQDPDDDCASIGDLGYWRDRALQAEDHIDDRDQLHAALTELRAASRGLAFFDSIKCARWNAAYDQATQVLGLEDDR